MAVSKDIILLLTHPGPFKSNLTPLTQFQQKVRAIKFQKKIKFALLCKYFPDLFTQVKN